MDETKKRRRKRILTAVIIIIVLAVIVGIYVFAASRGSRKLSDNKIVISTDNGSYIVTLYDNPTANDLLAKLPLTLTVTDYPGYDEKVIRLSDTLLMEDAPAGGCPQYYQGENAYEEITIKSTE